VVLQMQQLMRGHITVKEFFVIRLAEKKAIFMFSFMMIFDGDLL
jgi:hypothetical protein